jgi:hypothetical protein
VLASKELEKARVYEEVIEEQKYQMEEMNTQHQQRVAQMEQYYLNQMKNMRAKVVRYEGLAILQI